MYGEENQRFHRTNDRTVQLKAWRPHLRWRSRASRSRTRGLLPVRVLTSRFAWFIRGMTICALIVGLAMMWHIWILRTMPTAAQVEIPSSRQSCTPRTCLQPMRYITSPQQLKDDKTFVLLSTFPGSGNTWVRSIISEASRIWTGSVFNDVQLILNGFDGEAIDPYRRGFTQVSVIKSHYPALEVHHPMEYNMTTHAIVVMRNPFHCMLSYFRLEATDNHTGEVDRATTRRNLPVFLQQHAREWVKFAAHWLPPHYYKVLPAARLDSDFVLPVAEDEPTVFTSTETGNYARPVKVLVVFYEDLVSHFSVTVQHVLHFLRDALGKRLIPHPKVSLACAMLHQTRLESEHRQHTKTINPYLDPHSAFQTSPNLIKWFCNLVQDYWFEEKWGRCEIGFQKQTKRERLDPIGTKICQESLSSSADGYIMERGDPPPSNTCTPRMCYKPKRYISASSELVDSSTLILLTSFPGSNSKWVRALVREGTRLWTGSIYRDQPEESQSEDINPFRRAYSQFGVVETHFPAMLEPTMDRLSLSRANRAILIIRNPFDCLREAWHSPGQVRFPEFIRNQTDTWLKFANFWLPRYYWSRLDSPPYINTTSVFIRTIQHNFTRPMKVLVVFYEDLTMHFMVTFEHIFQFLRQNLGSKLIPSSQNSLKCALLHQHSLKELASSDDSNSEWEAHPQLVQQFCTSVKEYWPEGKWGPCITGFNSKSKSQTLPVLDDRLCDRS